MTIFQKVNIVDREKHIVSKTDSYITYKIETTVSKWMTTRLNSRCIVNE